MTKIIVGVDPKHTDLVGEELQREVVRHLTSLLTYPLIGRLPDSSYVVSADSEYDIVWVVSPDGYVRRDEKILRYLTQCKPGSACKQGCGCKCLVDDGYEKNGEARGDLHCSQLVKLQSVPMEEGYQRGFLEVDQQREYNGIAIESWKKAGPQGARGFDAHCFGLIGLTGPAPPKS